MLGTIGSHRFEEGLKSVHRCRHLEAAVGLVVPATEEERPEDHGRWVRQKYSDARQR